MKHIFLGMIAIALLGAPTYAHNGKKKVKKSTKIECKKDNCCDQKGCPKDAKCPPFPICSGK